MTRIALALALLATSSAVALADRDGHDGWRAGRRGWISEGQVARRLEAQGFRVRQIEAGDGRYKVKVLAPNRRHEKLYVSPRSGAVIGVSRDDD